MHELSFIAGGGSEHFLNKNSQKGTIVRGSNVEPKPFKVDSDFIVEGV